MEITVTAKAFVVVSSLYLGYKYGSSSTGDDDDDITGKATFGRAKDDLQQFEEYERDHGDASPCDLSLVKAGFMEPCKMVRGPCRFCPIPKFTWRVPDKRSWSSERT